jgi:Skp family chaperone for outer membrane proteins
MRARGARRLWVAVAAACALAVGGALAVPGAAQDQAAAPAEARLRIAVVDMDRVLRASGEWQDAAEQRARMRQTMQRTVEKLAREEAVLRNQHENLPPGSTERLAKAAEVERAARKLQQTQAGMELEISAAYRATVRSVFGRISRASADYAARCGIALVLKKRDIDFDAPDSIEQGLQISTTEVIYADPALDISGAIIAALNADYSVPIEVK